MSCDTAASRPSCDEEEGDRVRRQWDDWACGVPIEVLVDRQRSLVRSVLRYVPRKRRHEILHNQRARLLAVVLKARTDVVIATLPFHVHD